MALLARLLRARPSAPAQRAGLPGGGAPRLPAGARAEDKGAGRPGAPPNGGRAEGPRSLAAMPGPRTLNNLVEFFCKDGFSRIHEIQVAARPGQEGERLGAALPKAAGWGEGVPRGGNPGRGRRGGDPRRGVGEGRQGGGARSGWGGDARGWGPREEHRAGVSEEGAAGRGSERGARGPRIRARGRPACGWRSARGSALPAAGEPRRALQGAVPVWPRSRCVRFWCFLFVL